MLLRPLSIFAAWCLNIFVFHLLLTRSSLKSLVSLGIVNLCLLLLVFVFKRDILNLRSKLREIWQGALILLGMILSSSLLIRLYFSSSENINVMNINGVSADIDVLRFFLVIIFVYQTYCFCTMLIFGRPNSLLKIEPLKFHYRLASLIILFIAFCWGWAKSLGRFPGLELIYLIKNKDVHFDFIPIILALCLFILITYKLRNIASTFSKKIICTEFFIFFICTFGLLTLSRSERAIRQHAVLLNKDGAYLTDYNLIIKKTAFEINPITYLLENSVQEYLRIKSFGLKKRIMPFFKNTQQNLSQNDIEARLNVLLQGNESIPFKNFPALRFKKGALNSSRPNVVIIVLETFQTGDSDSFKGRDSPYPFMEEIAKESLTFTHCFANAECTYEGESAISSSLPIWGIINAKEKGLLTYSYNSSYLKTFKNNGYYSELSAMENFGQFIVPLYQRKFLTSVGWTEESSLISRINCYSCPFFIAGIENISPLFDKDLNENILDLHINRGDEKSAQDSNYGVSYIHDEYGYQKLLNKIAHSKEPFFLVTHTQSSHTNYPVPFKYRPEGMMADKDRLYYGAKYADSALRLFFEKAKKLPNYKNTIFVLISDHTSINRELCLYDRYHIPLVIHAPHILEKKAVINDPAFQIDVGPTLLEIIGLSGEYTSFGKNLYNPTHHEKRGMILPNWDGYLVFVYDPYIAKVDVDKVYEIYNFRENKHKNLINDPHYKQETDQTHQEFLKMYQIFADTIYGNKIYPADHVGTHGQEIKNARSS